MMQFEEQLKLQAYLDGELPEAEARQMAARLARDPEAAALMTELRQTRSAVVDFEKEIRLPETREFYWSKIQREIQQQEKRPQETAAASSWIVLLRRALMPLTAVAMVALLLVMVGKEPAGLGSETSLHDAGAFTYHDFERGATLVWLSYPAENEFAEYEDAMFE